MAQSDNELVKEIKKLYEEKYQSLSGDEIAVYLLERLGMVMERLDKGTRRLNCLTIWLIVLTLILTILTGIHIRVYSIMIELNHRLIMKAVVYK